MNRAFFHTHRTSLIATTILCLLLTAYDSDGQLISGNAFLKGNYVEVGLAPYGIYGSTVDAPAGYHARSAMEFDAPSFKKLGFVADPDKDGWTVGTPNKYRGDYFLPAAPYIGWGVYVGGRYYVADRSENGNKPTQGAFATWQPIPAGAIQSVTTTATQSEAIWETVVGGLRVRKIITVPMNGTYFTVRVVTTNTTAAATTNIFYNEYINPDNDAVWDDIPENVDPDVTTNNAIVYQNPADNKVLATALGWKYNTYLGLGSKDCRAQVCRGLNFEDVPWQIDAMGYYYGDGQSAHSGADVGTDLNHYIAISFKLGALAPGDSTAFTYAYILSESDLDEALGRTDAQFESKGALYLPGATIPACPGDKLPLSVTNAGDLSWTWSSANTNVNGVTGLDVSIDVGKTPVAYSVTGTGVCGTKTIQITVAPDQPTPPITSAEVDYCLNTAAVPLSAAGSAGATLAWSINSGFISSSPTAPTPLTARAGTTTWYVRQTSATGCVSGATSTKVLVRPPDNIAQTITICDEQLPYSWNGIRVPLAGYAVATYKTTNQYGCDSVIMLNLLTTPKPDINVTKSNDIDCAHSSARLLATGGGTVHWEPATGLTNPNASNPIAQPAQTTTYTATITSDAGCSSTASITVDVSATGSYLLPSAFSPNNDGHNDCFGLQRAVAGISKLEIGVYDRLGRQVFHTTNPGDCWDGTFNGRNSPAGTYVYMVRGVGACGLIDQKGTVTLVR